MVHLRLLSTSPRGDAVTFGFRSENLDLEGTSTPPTQDTLRRTPLPARPAGETVQAAKLQQADELLHMPAEPARVDHNEERRLPVELRHPPDEPAGAHR